MRRLSTVIAMILSTMWFMAGARADEIEDVIRKTIHVESFTPLLMSDKYNAALRVGYQTIYRDKSDEIRAFQTNSPYIKSLAIYRLKFTNKKQDENFASISYSFDFSFERVGGQFEGSISGHSILEKIAGEWRILFDAATQR